jgi:PKD repeat protein
MKKQLLLASILLIFTSVKSQNCNGFSCIANPNIEQQEKIFCYEDQLQLNPNCPNFFEETDDCIKVCELTSFTYTTPYHIGSSFNWSVIGGQLISTTPSGNTISILWDSVGSGAVSVIEQDSMMCSKISTICIDIIPKPIADIITSINSDTICQGSSMQFQGIDLNNSTITQTLDADFDSCNQQNQYDSTQFAYELQYFWDFGDGSTSVDQNPIHVFDNPGSYTVSLSISNSCQCYDVVTTNIIVINTPGPSITNCVGPICEGDTAEYCTDAVLPDWTIVGGTIFNSSSTNNCIAVVWDNINNELDDGSGELLVGDLISACGQSKSFYSVPVVPSNPIIKGDIIVCPGNLESYSFECIPGIDYSWSISGGWGGTIISGNNTSEILVSFDQWISNTSFQISLNMSSSTLKCMPPPVILNVDVLPPINWSVGISPYVCEDDIVTYSDWSGSQYNWIVMNGSTNSTLPNSQIDVNWDQGPGNGMIIVEPIISGIYCQTSKSFPVNIAETPISAINIIGDSLICPGLTYMYSVEESNATSSSNVSYNWAVIGGTASITNGENCTIAWDPVGPYSISITNNLLSSPNCSSPVFTKPINAASVIGVPMINGSSMACLNSVSTFNLSTIYPSWAVISWGVSNADLGSVVVGQGSSQVQVEWGNQNGTTDVVIDVEVCGVTYSHAFPITFINQPISFAASSSPVCSETIVTFNSTAGLGTYNWNFGDNTSSFLSNPDKSYDEPGNYLVSLSFVDAVTQCSSTFSSVITVEGISGKLLPEGNSLFCSSSSINQPLYIASTTTATPLVEWFQNGNLVSTSSTYTVVSSPPSQSGTGSYDVVLTDVNGCSNTLNTIDISTVNCSGGGGGGWCGGGLGCPALVPLTYASNCNSGQGTKLFNFSSPNGNTVMWRVDNGSISSSINYPIDFNKAGIYKVKCLFSGCLLGSEQITVPVVVKTDYSAICDPSNGNQITYFFKDRSSYLLGYGTATYDWDFGDGNTSNLQNPNHVYGSNGTYIVDFTVNYGTYSCNKITTITVTDFNVTYSYSGLECENTPTITFTSVSSPTNIASWSWDFGDGATSAREMPRRTYNPSSTYITTLLVTDVNGCQASDNKTIIIEQNPIIFSVTNLGPFCSNDSPTDLTSAVNFITGNGEVASWSGTGIYYDPVTQIYYFNPMLAGGGSHEICVTITDNNGCYVTECINIDVLCPEIPRVFGESEYCYTWFNNISLQTQSIYTSYQWYKNSIALSTTWSNLYDNTNVGIYDYTVEVVDNNGCTVISEPFTVNMYNSPNAVWVSANTNLCPGEEITLSHNGSQANVDYYWNTLPQQTGQTANINAISDYEYTVTAVNEFGCESVSYPVIVPTEIPMCGLLSGCLCDDEIINSSGSIIISGLNNSWQYSNYEWLLNGVSFPTPNLNTNLIIDPSDPNYLTVCSAEITLAVTDNNGCTSISYPLTVEPNCSECIINSIGSTHTVIACDSYTWIDGITYTNSNNFATFIYPSVVGDCDSVVTLDLTINNSNTGVDTQFACNSYTWANGITYISSNNIANFTTTSVNGCDSVVTLDLTINYSNTAIDTQYACNSYTWIDGVTYLNSNNSATHTVVGGNTNGCDSVITLDLTINYSNQVYLDTTVCDSHLWNSILYTVSEISSQTLTNSAGCDSVVTLDLTVNYEDSSYTIDSTCSSYLWNGTTYNSTGIYTYNTNTVLGCDSILTLDLTVLPIQTSMQNIVMCDGDSLIVGTNTYYDNGIYTDTFSSVSGCDSILVTQVVLNDPLASLSFGTSLLNAFVTGGSIPYYFELGNQNGMIVNSVNNFGTSISINPITNGLYYFFIIDANNCISDTVFYQIDIFPSAFEDLNVKNLVIYPNPSRNILNVSFTSDTKQDLRVRILNVIGEELISDNLVKFIGEYTKQINLSDNAKGIYFLEIETNNEIINKKIILQ